MLLNNTESLASNRSLTPSQSHQGSTTGSGPFHSELAAEHFRLVNADAQLVCDFLIKVVAADRYLLCESDFPAATKNHGCKPASDINKDRGVLSIVLTLQRSPKTPEQRTGERIDAHRSEYIGINEFHDEERGHYGYIYDDVETDTLLQFIWTDSVKTYANVAVGSPSLWTNVIPYTDEGDFESVTLVPGEYMFPIEPGDVFLLKGTAMLIREIEKGDMNSDGRINIRDVLRVVRLILHQPPPPTEYELWAADYNDDDRIDILDVIGIVNEILRGGL